MMENIDEEKNKYMIDFAKYDIEPVFWNAVQNKYGYERENPTLKTLFMHLSLTAFSQSIDEKYLEDVQRFIADRNQADALVFVDHWMHHRTDSAIFDEFAEMVEHEVNLAGILQDVSVEAFKEADVFPIIDRAIIVYISNSLMDQLEDYEQYMKLIRLRRSKHHYEKYKNVYEALYYTVEMHVFQKEHAQGLTARPCNRFI